MYKAPIYAEKEILRILLEDGNSVYFRSKLQGYGLIDSDFDAKDQISISPVKDEKKKSEEWVKKYPDCSRRIFGYWKESLLKRKLITKLRSKGKKPVYYSITPLGIAYLCKELAKLEERQAKRILELLGLFYSFQAYKESYWSDVLVEFDFSKAWEKVSVTVLPSKLFDELRKVCTFIKIESDKDDYVIRCDYPLKKEMFCPMEKYTILNEDAKTKFYAQVREMQKSNPDIEPTYSDIFCDFDEFSQNRDIQWPVSEPVFYYRISMFILYAFHFNLVKNHLDSFDEKFAYELENKGELKGKKLKTVFGEYSKLGLYEYGVLEVANQFANHLDSVLGSNLDDIKQLTQTLSMFEKGIPEMPTYIETAKSKPLQKKKRKNA